MDDRIVSTLRRLEAFIEGHDDALAIPRQAGQFIYALLRATGAKSGVEIGTSYGYSALWAGGALAAHDGSLITIDRDPRKHEVARGYFDEAGLGGVIRCETGVAIDILDRIEGPIDYVLNDADKENCVAYVAKVVDRLASGAVVLTDNTLSHPEALAPFCTWVRRRSDFASAHLPVGNGMELSVYLGNDGR